MKNKSNFIAKAKVILASLIISMFTSNCTEVEKNAEPQSSKSLEKNLRVAAGSVYLCFDDGPSGNTPTLVNNLKNAGTTATFFIWGNRISSNSAAFNAIKNAGFSIQNHSYTHQHMLNWTYTQVYNDIRQCQTAIQNAGGGTPKYFRPPYLEVNATIRSACSALGLTVVMPTVDTKDWNGASTSAIVSACNNLQNGGNTLMHDGYSTTNAAIGTIVSNLRGRGLTPIKY
jgi:peptidoglycan/xylan/chitin deacetylase (PgdA/CDA1 family)